MKKPAGYLQNVKLRPEISDAVLDAVEFVESRGNPNAVSPVGAMGAYQFMPGTASDLGIDPFDPVAARGGARKYLSYLYDQTGSLEDALRAYNFGLGNLKKSGSKNLPRETKDYVSRVLARLGQKEQGTPPSLVSQPVNQQDPIPPPEASSTEATPESPPPSEQMPQESMAGLGKLYHEGQAPELRGIGEGPLAMVGKILKDPMNIVEAKKGGHIKRKIASKYAKMTDPIR